MNDTVLPKPAQTPTPQPTGITPPPSNLGAQPIPPQTQSMPGFIPATAPMNSQVPQPPTLPSTPPIMKTPSPMGMGNGGGASLPPMAPSIQQTPNMSGSPMSQTPPLSSPMPKVGTPISMAAQGPGALPPKSPLPTPSPLQTKPGQVPPGKGPGVSPVGKDGGVPPSPQMAKPKKSIFSFLPFILVGIGVLSAIGFGIFWFMNQGNSTKDTTPTDTTPVKTKEVNLQYWGLWEPTTVMSEVITDFEQQNPRVKITYTQQSPQEYRERLQTAIATGTGPDIFRFHASWTPMLRNELSALPEKVMTSSEFEQTFYPVANEQLTLGGQKVGIPLMYDGLGLYYNKQIFNVANENPPQTWEDVKRLAQELTIRDAGKITRAGIALGTTSNVEHYSDILGLMLYQNGADPLQPNSEKGQEALSFYTSFSKTLKAWDDTLPSSTVAFSRGDVVMMLAPSWRVHEIKAKNPNLEFGIVPVPQLADTQKTTWASFWAEGVSSQSANKDVAWQFLKYLSSKDVEKKFYSDAKKVRAFGEIYSRIDLGSEIASDEYVGAYIQDASSARSSYLNAYTHDNGINDRVSKYYLDAVNAMNLGTAADQVLPTVEQGVLQVLQQYGFQVQAVPATPQ